MKTRRILIMTIVMVFSTLACYAQQVQTEDYKLLDNNPSAYEGFGRAICENNNQVFIGIPADNTSNGNFSGSVNVYNIENNNLILQQKLISSDGQTGDGFGEVVSIDSNTIAISASADDNSLGAVYIFEKQTNENWIETSKITAEIRQNEGSFGNNLYLKDNTLLIKSNIGYESVVHVFCKQDSIWNLNQTLTYDSGGIYNYHIGISIDMNDEYIFLGTSTGVNAQGIVHIWKIQNNTWLYHSSITGSNLSNNAQFGRNVVSNNNKLFVSAIYMSTVYEFTLQNNAWIETEIINNNSSFFGYNLCLNENRLIIGTSETNPKTHVFENSANQWTENIILETTDLNSWSEYSESICIVNNLVIIGAPYDNSNGSASGSCYVYDITPNTPPSVIPIEDIVIDEDGSYNFDLNQYFTDSDSLTFSVNGNTNIEIEIVNEITDITPLPNWNGIEEVIFTATDTENQTISDTVLITVNPINDPPIIVNPLVDFSFNEDHVDSSINLNNVFQDIDNTLSFYCSGNENIAVDIINGIATLTPLENWNGSETITFVTTDETNSISDDIIVTINPVNDAPSINLPEEINFPENGSLTMNFNDYANDIDQDTLTFEVSGNIHIHYDGTMFTADPNWNGSENITVTVSDGELTAFDQMMVNISSIDNPTTQTDSIATIIIEEDFVEEITINLDDYFNDVDSDIIYSVNIDPNLVNIELNDNFVTFTSIADSSGTAVVTVNANNLQTTFGFIVTPVNDEPEILSYNPTDTELNLSEVETISFSVIIEDIDSELSYLWFINEVTQSSTIDSLQTNFVQNGTYIVKSLISDGEYEIETVWNVQVNLVGSNTETEIPLVTKLVGNYPNPFNPQTTIKFNLLEKANVNLSIYNVKGQKVKTLANENLSQGQHQFIWKGNNNSGNYVSSGIYFYQIQTKKSTKTGKLLLMK